MLDWLRVQFTKAHITETIVKGFAVFGVIKAFFEFSDYFFEGNLSLITSTFLKIGSQTTFSIVDLPLLLLCSLYAEEKLTSHGR